MRQPLYNHVSPALSELEVEMIRDIPPGGNWQNIPQGLSKRVDQIKRRSESGIVHTTYYGRLRAELPSYTVNTYFSRIGNGCFIHPSQRRLISLREGARLQSFPDSTRFHGSRRAQYEQIGNAVPPLLGLAVGGTLPKGKVADLFAGAGGLSAGLELAGSEVVYATDRSHHACATFNGAHLKPVAEVADLADPDQHIAVARKILDNGGGGVDLLVAGPPCQSFSTAGGRNHRDIRASLLWVPFRIAEMVKPRVLVIENVQGILSSAGRSLPPRIADEMKRLGYTFEMAVLRAEEYGVPQRRTRVFFVGMKDESWTPPAPQFARVGKAQDGLRGAISVGEAISDLPPLVPGGGEEESWLSSPATTPYQRWIRGLGSVAALFEQENTPCLVR